MSTQGQNESNKLRILWILLTCIALFGCTPDCNGPGCTRTSSPFTTANVAFTPGTIYLQRGSSQEVTLRVTSFGVVGNHTLSMAGGNGLTVTPASYPITLSPTGSVDRVFTVTASESAPLGRQTLTGGIPGFQNNLNVEVVSEATPDFTFTATPTAVTAANESPSGNVNFALTSVGGFAGDVVVSWSASGGLANPIPDDQNVTRTISTSAPTEFTLQMLRYYGTEPVTLTFTATHQASSTTRTVTVTINLP